MNLIELGNKNINIVLYLYSLFTLILFIYMFRNNYDLLYSTTESKLLIGIFLLCMLVIQVRQQTYYYNDPGGVSNNIMLLMILCYQVNCMVNGNCITGARLAMIIPIIIAVNWSLFNSVDEEDEE
jgi:hypothetical protein